MEQNINQKELFENNENYLNFCKNISNEELFEKDYQLIYKIWVLYDLYSISSEEFKIKKTIKESLDKEINENLNKWVIKRLLESAFIFANLNSDDYIQNIINTDEKEKKIEEVDWLRNQSYRIAISIYYYWKYLKEEILEWRKNNDEWFFNNNNLIYRLFTRLWILSKARDEKIEDIDIFSIDLQWKIEATNKELNNNFSIKNKLKENFQNNEFESKFWENFEWFKNDEVFFSDFQKWIIDNLFKYKKFWWWTQWKSIAISAPTSAWKTFILKKYIIYKILENFLQDSHINIIFIVPSKALINELKTDFIELFHDYKIKDKDFCDIHTHISWDDFLENYKWNSNLFLFTQERLNYFYSSLEESEQFKIDLVVVDEAHKVGYWYRWTLLSYIVKKIKNNNTQIVLLAPLLSKLNKFTEEFWLENLNEEFSNFWLVAKNMILVNFEMISWRNHVCFYLKDKFNLLFNIKISQTHINSQEKYLSFLSKNFNKNTQSIIFRYWSWEVKTQAKHLYELIKNLEKKNFPLNNYLDDILPKNFPLKEYLENWISYHNWALPVSIKSNVEKLFKEWYIKYLFANSTLLEWVNLPAKNIFVWQDWSRKNISKLDFMNLLWRTWRLNEHLSWNIFLTNSDSYQDKIIDIDKNATIDLENNISNCLDDSNSDIENWIKSKFDRFLDYIRPWSLTYKEPIRFLNEEDRLNSISEYKDFEYMLWYFIALIIDLDVSDSWKIKLKFDFIWPLIYWDKEYKKNKLEDLESYLKILFNDLKVNEKYDKDFLNIVRKNIFIDPRKQLDLYENIINWKNNFIKNNIIEYSNIISLLSNKNILYKESVKYWEQEFEKDITEKTMKINNLIEEIKEIFIQKYYYNFPTKKVVETNEYIKNHQDNKYYFNNIYYHSGEYCYYDEKETEYCYIKKVDNISKLINQWISWVSLKNILWKNEKFFFPKLKLINDEVTFNYLNAFSIYFEIVNLWHKKYIEENEIEEYDESKHKFDTNFIYYMELWTFYPNLIYLISKWVSRESAIWLTWEKNNKWKIIREWIIRLFPLSNDMTEKEYFDLEKEKILNYLETNKKYIIKDELEKFIY